ncbi:MAG: TetR/AcrR family transcriptional regulator [Candidatus Dormibacteraeota bacterium]|nr:TetR/AcrR family transcriptional regulator [Candidatus Dormibacteraeota bacterium]
MPTGTRPRRDGAGDRSDPTKPGDRRARAKARTRSALLEAAQRFIVDGRLHAPILEITQAADVGLGSFYNHFESREALFAAATEEALESLGLLLDQLSAGFADPAATFAQGFRLMGRLLRSEPLLMHVAFSSGPALIHASRGLVPRARRDLEAGVWNGRFKLRDPEVALGIIVGTALCLEELLREQPERDAASATDQAAAGVLRMLGLTPDEADLIAGRPLPDVQLNIAGSASPIPDDKRRHRPQRRNLPTRGHKED